LTTKLQSIIQVLPTVINQNNETFVQTVNEIIQILKSFSAVFLDAEIKLVFFKSNQQQLKILSDLITNIKNNGLNKM